VNRLDFLLELLMDIALFKQRLESQLQNIWRVPLWQLRFYSNACIRLGRVLEMLERRKREKR